MIRVRIANPEALNWYRAGGALHEAVAVGVKRVLIRASDAVTMRIRGGNPLNQRSGRLAKSWSLKSGGQGESEISVEKAGTVHGELTSALAYAAIHEFGEQNLRPKKGEYLAIPIGPNKMGSGAIRASQASPRQIPGLFFKRFNGKLFGLTSGKGKLGAAGGGKGGPVVRKLTFWFLLVEKVRIPPRRYVTLATEDAGKDAQRIVDAALQEHIDRSGNG